MRRSHPLAALFLLVGAFFVRHAAQCGVMGRWVTQRLTALLGNYGCMLRAVTLAGAGVSVGAPILVAPPRRRPAADKTVVSDRKPEQVESGGCRVR